MDVTRAPAVSQSVADNRYTKMVPPPTGNNVTDTANWKAALVAVANGGKISAFFPGTYVLNDVLVVPSNVTIHLSRGVVVQQGANVNKGVFRNKAFTNSTIAVNSFTSSVTSSPPGSINTGTIGVTAHGRSVGDFVSVLGATSYGYQGVFRVIAVPDANTLTVEMFAVASQPTATSTIMANSVVVITGGTGYAVNDTVTIAGGTPNTATVLTVTAVNAGAITGTSITVQGDYAMPAAQSPVAQGTTSGAGTGATFDIKWVPSSTIVATGMTLRLADHNIAFEGAGVIDYNSANNGGGAGGLLTMAVILAHVYEPRIEDVQVINGLKYAWLLANVRGFKSNGAKFNTGADGIHLMGPVFGADIRATEGFTNDDMIALTIGDFTSYEICRGDIEGVTVDGIYSLNSLTVMKITGNDPYKFRGIALRNAYGSVQLDVVSMLKDSNLYSTMGTDITLQNIQTRPGAGYTHLHVKDTQFEKIVFDTCNKQNTDIGSFINVAYTSNVNHLVMDRLTHEKQALMHALSITSGGTVGRLDFQNSRLLLGNHASNASVTYVDATSTLGDANFDSVYSQPAGSNTPYFRRAGTSSRVRFNNCTAKGGNSLYTEDTSGLSSIDVHLSNSVADGTQNGIVCRNTVNIHSGSSKMPNQTNNPISVLATGIVRLLGDLDTVVDISVANVTAGGVFSCNGSTIRADASIVTPQRADTFYNRNSAATPGLGLVCYDGTYLRRLHRRYTVLGYAASVVPNPFQGDYQSVGTLTGNISVGAIINAVPPGDPLTFRFAQDGTGSRTVTWDASFKFASAFPASGAAGTSCTVTFISDGSGKYIAQGASIWA